MPFEPRFPRYIDSSMRSTFASCPQKFYKEYICRISRKAFSPDLHAGAAFAAAMEATRRKLFGLITEEPPAGFTLTAFNEAAVECGVAALMAYYGDYEPPPSPTGKPHIKSLSNMCTAFLDYWQHYSPATDELIPYRNADGSAAIEYTFATPLPILHPETNEPLIFCGRFDMLGHYRNYPEARYVVDEKTTKVLGPMWATKWGMRGQFIGYCWACREAGLPAVGAIVRGIGILQTEIKHAQAIITIPNWQIDRWYGQLLNNVEKMVQLWQIMRQQEKPPSFEDIVPADVWDYSYADACESYNGCPYMELCTTDNPANWLIDYEERLWNPLQRDPTASEKKEAAA